MYLMYFMYLILHCLIILVPRNSARNFARPYVTNKRFEGNHLYLPNHEFKLAFKWFFTKIN